MIVSEDEIEKKYYLHLNERYVQVQSYQIHCLQYFTEHIQ